MNRILFLVALFLSSASFAFSSESSSQQLDANPLFEITFTPVSCPEGHDGSAELVSIDPEIILSDLTWELTTASLELSISLENEVISISGLDYLNEHCLSFTSAGDESFNESICFQNDQLVDQSIFEPNVLFIGVPDCPTGLSEILAGFSGLDSDYFSAFEFSLQDVETGETLIPESAGQASQQYYIMNGIPAVNLEFTWTIEEIGCSWFEPIDFTAEYALPSEVTWEILNQDADGAELGVELVDMSENWIATLNGENISEFPFEVYIETGVLASLEICHPESPSCCDVYTFEIPEYVPVYGCTDMASCSYNEDATENDGSCLYFADCGDFNGDGYTGIDDLLDLLSNFGMYGENLAGDMNYDGVVDTMDLLIFLVVFG